MQLFLAMCQNAQAQAQANVFYSLQSFSVPKRKVVSVGAQVHIMLCSVQLFLAVGQKAQAELRVCRSCL